MVAISSSQPMRIGVIGAGAIFKAYESAIDVLPNVQIDAVMDVNSDALHRSSRTGRKIYTSVESLMREPIDAVLILTPNCFHEEHVKACLEARVDVLCEKPLAISHRGIINLFSLAKKYETILYPAMHCRFRPEIQYVYGIREPLVRFSQVYQEHWLLAPAWYFDARKSGGGVVLDVGINQIDWILPLTPHLSVDGVEVQLDKNNIEVQCRVIWNYKGGMGTSEWSWNSINEQKYTILEYESGRVIHIDHIRHTVNDNGIILGPLECFEYVSVMSDFMLALSCKRYTPHTVLSEVFRIIKIIYQKSNLPFLKD